MLQTLLNSVFSGLDGVEGKKTCGAADPTVLGMVNRYMHVDNKLWLDRRLPQLSSPAPNHAPGCQPPANFKTTDQHEADR